jgi:hypothetical protein
MNRLDPNVEILLTDSFLQRIDHLRPYIFHELDRDGLRYWIEVNCQVDWKDKNNKNSSYSINYKPFSTIFPQMWINESKSTRGENI